jgi:hypothetical protein
LIFTTSPEPLILEQGSTGFAAAVGLPPPGTYQWTTADSAVAALASTNSPEASVTGGSGSTTLTVEYTNDDTGVSSTATTQVVAGLVRLHAQAVDQDDPHNQTATPLAEGNPAYGGSIPENADDLELSVAVEPQELKDKVQEYEWSVEGDGSADYTPPPPAEDADRWEVGDIRPRPGILKFKVKVTFEGGTTIEKSRDINAISAMNTTSQSVLRAVVLALALCQLAGQEAERAPIVQCGFPGLERKSEDRGEVFLANNIEKIRIEMWIVDNGSRTRRPVMADERAEWTAKAASLRVVVEELTNEDAPRTVEAKLFADRRRTLSSGEEVASGILFLPVADEWRLREVRAALDGELEREPLVSASERSKEIYRALVEAQTKTAHFENRVGEFSVECEYFSSEPGFWNGVVKSEPLLLRVEYAGNYLEAHKIDEARP